MSQQYVAPPIAAALEALHREAQGAAARLAAFQHQVGGGQRLARQPDGSWVLMAAAQPRASAGMVSDERGAIPVPTEDEATDTGGMTPTEDLRA